MCQWYWLCKQTICSQGTPLIQNLDSTLFYNKCCKWQRKVQHLVHWHLIYCAKYLHCLLLCSVAILNVVAPEWLQNFCFFKIFLKRGWWWRKRWQRPRRKRSRWWRRPCGSCHPSCHRRRWFCLRPIEATRDSVGPSEPGSCRLKSQTKKSVTTENSSCPE